MTSPPVTVLGVPQILRTWMWELFSSGVSRRRAWMPASSLEWRCSVCRKTLDKEPGSPPVAAVCSSCGRWVCHNCTDAAAPRQLQSAVCADCATPQAPLEASSPSDEGDSYWEPRVMRHHTAEGGQEYAIHEVYFDNGGNVNGYTTDALSPREPSIERLRATLVRLLDQGAEEITCGDLGYTYDRGAVEDWLTSLDDPSLDYKEDE
jgi:hypothetical protein